MADAALLEAFLARHRGLIRRVVLHTGGRRAEPLIDDVQQNVLMSLWRRLGAEQALDLTPSYVYKAVVRETVRALRAEAARQRDTADEDEGDGQAAGGGPFEAVERREQAEALMACLSGLSAERQRAARLHLQGFSVDEIMRLNGWPYQKARNLVARAMADLRDALRERGIHA
jgi:RNA polymerase sigma factor (sigma-70 family)